MVVVAMVLVRRVTILCRTTVGSSPVSTGVYRIAVFVCSSVT